MYVRRVQRYVCLNLSTPASIQLAAKELSFCHKLKCSYHWWGYQQSQEQLLKQPKGLHQKGKCRLEYKSKSCIQVKLKKVLKFKPIPFCTYASFNTRDTGEKRICLHMFSWAGENWQRRVIWSDEKWFASLFIQPTRMKSFGVWKILTILKK